MCVLCVGVGVVGESVEWCVRVGGVVWCVLVCVVGVMCVVGVVCSVCVCVVCNVVACVVCRYWGCG